MGITSVGVEGSGGISLLSSKEASSRWPTLPFFCIFPVPLPPFREDVTSSSVPEVKLRVCPGLPTSEVDDELGVSGTEMHGWGNFLPVLFQYGTSY